MAECLGCENCPFKGRKVATRGNPASELVIVGEGPGKDEIIKGEPFVGQSWQVILKAIPNIDSYDPYITNATRCKPSKDKTPAKMQQAILACRDRLMQELTAHPRRLIIAFGSAAAQSLTGNLDLKITQARGQVVESPLAEKGIFLSVHPAFLLRGGGSFKLFCEDLQKALELYNSGVLRKTWTEPRLVGSFGELFHDTLPDEKLELSADIETEGFNYRTDRILSVGFARVDNPTKVYITDDLAEVKQISENPHLRFAWHNGKFDVGFLRYNGINANVDDDTMLLSYALNENSGYHDLEHKMKELLGAPDYKHMIQPYLPNKKSSYALIPKDVLWDYQSKDICGTAMVLPIMRKEVSQDPNLEKLYTKVLLPASELLTKVESRGLLVDDDRIAENEIAFSRDLEAKGREICNLIGYDINPNSWIQVAHLLYDVLRMRGKKRSTAKEVVRDMPHPVAAMILEYRRIGKALGTYVRGVPKHKDEDGRIRSTYLLHNTPTGRLASRNPNLQNIPRDPRLKGQFVAAPGNVFIEADYSQAELRCLAIMSGDPALMEIYLSTDRSLHKEVALQRYGKGYTSDQYIRAKAVNFGIVYGRSAKSLADEFHYPVSEAQNDIDSWFAQFPVAHRFIQMCRMAPVRGQVMTTCFGRKRRFHLVSNENLNHVQNQAANFPHQSVASDCTLTSAIELDPILEARGVLIVNLVHDSILVELPNDPELIEWTKRTMSEVMVRKPTEWGLTKVPFKADFKIGTRWGSLEEQK